RLAVAYRLEFVKVYDVATGVLQLTLRGHSDFIRAVAFSPDGTRLATGSFDQTVRLWDAASGKQLQTFFDPYSQVWGVAFNPDGKQIAASYGDGRVVIWDIQTAKSVLWMQLPGTAFTLVYSPDGEWIASASSDNMVNMFSPRLAYGYNSLLGHSAPVWTVAFSRDGK